jgi:transposase-like protein
MCKVCRRTFNDKTGTIFHYSRLSFRAWLLLIIFLILTHTSINSISWLLDTSYMTVFRAAKHILFNLNQPIAELQGEVEMGRKPRRRGLKRRGRGHTEGVRFQS